MFWMGFIAGAAFGLVATPRWFWHLIYGAAIVGMALAWTMGK